MRKFIRASAMAMIGIVMGFLLLPALLGSDAHHPFLMEDAPELGE